MSNQLQGLTSITSLGAIQLGNQLETEAKGEDF